MSNIQSQTRLLEAQFQRLAGDRHALVSRDQLKQVLTTARIANPDELCQKIWDQHAKDGSINLAEFRQAMQSMDFHPQGIVFQSNPATMSHPERFSALKEAMNDHHEAESKQKIRHLIQSIPTPQARADFLATMAEKDGFRTQFWQAFSQPEIKAMSEDLLQRFAQDASDPNTLKALTTFLRVVPNTNLNSLPADRKQQLLDQLLQSGMRTVENTKLQGRIERTSIPWPQAQRDSQSNILALSAGQMTPDQVQKTLTDLECKNLSAPLIASLPASQQQAIAKQLFASGVQHAISNYPASIAALAKHLPIDQMIDVRSLPVSDRSGLLDVILRRCDTPSALSRQNALKVFEAVPNGEGKQLWQAMERSHLTESLFGSMKEADYDRIYPKLVQWKAIPDIRNSRTWNENTQRELGRFAAAYANTIQEKPMEADCKTMAIYLMSRFCQKMHIPEPVPNGYRGNLRDDARSVIDRPTPQQASRFRDDYQADQRDYRQSGLVHGPNYNYVPNGGNRWLDASILADGRVMREVRDRQGQPVGQSFQQGGTTPWFHLNPNNLRPGDVILLDTNESHYHHTLNIANVERNAQGQAIRVTVLGGTFDDLKDADSRTPPSLPYINYISSVHQYHLDPRNPNAVVPSDIWNSEKGVSDGFAAPRGPAGMDGISGRGHVKVMNWRQP